MNKSTEEILFDKIDNLSNQFSKFGEKLAANQEKTNRNTIEVDKWSGRLWAIVIMITMGLISQMTACVFFILKGV